MIIADICGTTGEKIFRDVLTSSTLITLLSVFLDQHQGLSPAHLKEDTRLEKRDIKNNQDWLV